MGLVTELFGLVRWDFLFQVIRVEGGEVQYDGISLHWRLPQMSAAGGDASTATLEFFAATDVNTVLPFSVEMYSTTSLCEIEV